MNSCELILPRKRTNPTCNFNIVELITDMIVNNTMNNGQLNTLSWALCMDITRIPDQNGVSLLYIMLEIHHSGREPSII